MRGKSLGTWVTSWKRRKLRPVVVTGHHHLSSLTGTQMGAMHDGILPFTIMTGLPPE